MAHRLHRVLGGLVAVGTVAALLAYVASLLGRHHWLLDLCAHFRPHLAALALVLLLAALLQRRWVVVAANLGLLAGTVPPLLPYFRAEAAPSGRAVVVLVANVNCHHGDPAQVIELLEKSDADIVGLIEIDERWMAALEPTLARWPHRRVHPYEGTFGLGLFSRWPLAGSVLDRNVLSVPAIQAETAGLGLLLVHPPPPVSGAIAAQRNTDLERFARHLSDLGPRPVLLGDLNITPWSVHFKYLLATTGLRDARAVAGAGILGTWPSQLPGILRIPIDHILVGGDVGVTAVEVSDPLGSDHRAVRAVLVVP